MKAAIGFLAVALSCFFGSGHTGGVTPVYIPEDCLQKLIQVDVPEALLKLQQLLCLYMKARKEQNTILYKQFLEELHDALIDAGCTVDEILSTEDFLAEVGDKVGEVAEQLGVQILQIAEDLGVLDIVLNFLCQLLGETLKSLSLTLSPRLSLTAGHQICLCYIAGAGALNLCSKYTAGWNKFGWTPNCRLKNPNLAMIDLKNIKNDKSQIQCHYIKK